MRKVLTAATVVFIAVGAYQSVFASLSQENAELSRINSVLNSIYPLIDAAQKQALPSERVHFHYDWLRRDIQSIQAGIAQKINAPAIAPRVVKPLVTTFTHSGQVSELL